ncbi:D-alanine--D-alanine ligase [candidate division KSB1 bacterium]|nr:D-alanine--D-alanine ligase [candidate division KSB1 bacterium]
MKLLVFCGGDSAERIVSLASGDAVAGWLAEAGHCVLKYDPARPGVTHTPSEKLAPPQIGTLPPLPRNTDGFDARTVRGILDLIEHERAEFVFPILHGGWGEDGTLQALLDWVNVPYACSGALASAMAMNKQAGRVAMAAAAVPIAKGFVVGAAEMRETAGVVKRAQREIGLPVIIKPLCSGSAVGVSVVRTEHDVEPALLQIAAQGDVALVETYFSGRELTATVVNGEAYPLIEIRPHEGFYDYANKYTAGRTDYLCPAPVTEPVAAAIRDAAVRAFNAIGCRGVVRVDFLLNERDEFICLEVNTLPGMTGTSLVPKSAAARGESPAELMQKVVRASLRKSAAPA